MDTNNINFYLEKLAYLENYLDGRVIRPVHPGLIIEDILQDNDITIKEFASKLEISEEDLKNIIEDNKKVDIDLAMRLAIVLNNSPQFWLNLQQKVDVFDEIKNNKYKYRNLYPIDV